MEKLDAPLPKVKAPSIGFVLTQEQYKYHWWSYHTSHQLRSNTKDDVFRPCFICLLFITYDDSNFVDKEGCSPHHDRCLTEIAPAESEGVYNTVKVTAKVEFINAKPHALWQMKCEACGKIEPDVKISLRNESR